MLHLCSTDHCLPKQLPPENDGSHLPFPPHHAARTPSRNDALLPPSHPSPHRHHFPLPRPPVPFLHAPSSKKPRPCLTPDAHPSARIGLKVVGKMQESRLGQPKRGEGCGAVVGRRMVTLPEEGGSEVTGADGSVSMVWGVGASEAGRAGGQGWVRSSEYEAVVRENEELRRAMREQFLPLQESYKRMQEEQRERELLVGRLEEKVRQLGKHLQATRSSSRRPAPS